MLTRRVTLSMAAIGLAGLILFGSGMVHAQIAQESSTRGLVGEVRELDHDSFVLIQKGTGDEYTLSLDSFNASTDLTTHGSGGQEQFQDGSQVAVLVDDDLTAVKILVKPRQPTVLPISGAVASVKNGTLTVVRPNGEVVEVQIPSGEPAPQAGAVVVGFARASESRGAPPVSTGLTTAVEMRTRLEGFLDEANRAAQQRPEQAGADLHERSARLAEILASHTTHHVAILLAVLERGNLPAQAEAAITRAHTAAKVGLERASVVAAKTRAALQDRGKSEDSRSRGPNRDSEAP